MADALTVRTGPPAARWSLRTGDPEAVSAALPLPLPRAINATTGEADRLAVCLGPDEWLLWTAEADRDAFGTATIPGPHSLVDISDRDVAIALAGAGACDALLTGCPRDVARLPVGWGGRTVFEDTGIILVRRAETAFDLLVARSRAPHILSHLDTVRQEFAAGL